MIESEKRLERKLKNQIEKMGGWCIKLLSTHIAGLPDRICLLPKGVIFFVELKTTKQKARKIQLAIHDKIRKLGFEVYVVDTSEGINETLNKYKC